MRSGAGGWSDGRDHRFAAEVFLSHGEDLLTGDGLDSLGVLEMMVGPEAEKGIEGADLGHCMIALILESIARQHTGLGVGEGLFGNSIL